jgi:hypothetical protein
MSDHYLIRIYESELNVIADETCNYTDIETGGSLFGLFSHGGGPTIFLATRPTARAARGPHTLELDPVVTNDLEQRCWDGFGVQGIGMWHSHHRIALYEPSSGDQERTRRYAARYQRPQYTEILANFLDEPDGRDGLGTTPHSGRSPGGGGTVLLLTPFYYVDARNLTRAEASLVVLQGESPLRRTLSGADLGPDLAASLRPASGPPRVPCQLTQSAATESSWLRRLTRGKPGGPSAAEHYEPDQSVGPDSGHLDEDARDVEGVRSAREDQRGREDTSEHGQAGRERAGRDGAERVGSAAVTVGAAQVTQPPLRPIPDPSGYLERFLEPLLAPLPGNQYEVTLEPHGPRYFVLILRSSRKATRLFLVTGWDGTQPVVVAAQLKLEGRDDLVWQPHRPGEVHQLDQALEWGLNQLRNVP